MMCSRIAEEYFLINLDYSFLREKGQLVVITETGFLCWRGDIYRMVPSVHWVDYGLLWDLVEPKADIST